MKVFRKSEVCTNGVIVSARPKMWGIVFDGLDGPGGADPGCPVVSVGSYRAEGSTDANGKVTITVPPTANHPNEDYVVIGRTEGNDYFGTSLDPETLYAAAVVRHVPQNTTKKVPLNQLKSFFGKKVPGKALEEFGSYLAIIEPEYVDWTEDQEQYPFVLVAEGAWDVTTSVAAPEGFIPDEPALSASVADGITAVQFTLTDIASDWTETVVNHTIKHNGETRLRQDKVPMFDKKPTTARNDLRKMAAGGATLLIDVLTNDRVAHFKAPITITAHTPADNGSAVLAFDGLAMNYTPNPGFSGVDTFTYTITDAIGGTATATVTVKVLGLPEISVRNDTAPEGNAGTTLASVNVVLSNETLVPVTVNYRTVDGTATAGLDYTPVVAALTFAPGQTRLPVTVGITGDTLAEAKEKFIVRLDSPTNATLAADSDGTVTIADDDSPEISIEAAASIVERDTGSGNVALTMTLSQAHADTVTVNVSTADGTAVAGSDYVSTSSVVTFPPGSRTKTIVIPVLYDTMGEPNETFYVDLSNPLNGTLTASRATVTIVNDDNSSFVTATAADFAAGTIEPGAALALTTDGEITLAPTAGDEFAGPDTPGRLDVHTARHGRHVGRRERRGRCRRGGAGGSGPV